MAAQGREFADVLEEAQALGYAEADPTFDVDGTDAAQKLVLLASLAFGQRIDVASVFKQGVDSVSPTDIDYARELGFCIKHLGIAKRQGSAIELRVHPTLIPKSKAIAQVDGVLNAVMINASGVGELLLVGPGAGSRPTASAVTADIAAIALSIAKGDQPSALNMGIPLAYFSAASIVDIDHVSSSWYLRLEAEGTPGVMAAITQCLSERDIGIASLIQKLDSPDVQRVPVVLLTDNASTAAIASAMKAIEALPSVGGQVTSLRVEHF
jgi:homoserine dehydrogenase